jgi:hypothetical protein
MRDAAAALRMTGKMIEEKEMTEQARSGAVKWLTLGGVRA